MSDKKLPNILITGTPCVGKSSLCRKLANELNLNWHDVSSVAVSNGFIEDIDKDLDCPVIDEDQVLDYLEPFMSKGGNVVEYHACELFPERWFNVVYVLRCDTTVLHDRLTERGYNQKKIENNIQCEIFQVLLDEARSSYKPEIVFEIKSETELDSKECAKQIGRWYRNYIFTENI